MTSSRYPQITDELLSAYIDDAVTEEEKALIETAIVDEPAIAWRLETLRYTINLLSSLPTVVLPRSFALSELQTTGQVGAHTVAQEPAWRIHAGLHNLRESWQNFWLIGNLFLRNATAISLAIFLVLFISNQFVTNNALSGANMNRQSSSSVTTMRSHEQSVKAAKISPTALAQASTARAVNSPSPTLSQPTIASQKESANVQATPASQADSASDPSLTAAEVPEVAAAAAPLPDSAARPGTANSQEDPGVRVVAPGPDEHGLGQGEFAPSALPSNESAMPPNAAAGIQLTTNSPLMKQQATATMTATVSVLVYNAQSQATATQIAPTLAPPATKPVTSNQVERVQTVTVPPANGSQRQWSWLLLAQLMSAFVTLILSALWWRSGEPHHRVRRQQR